MRLKRLIFKNVDCNQQYVLQDQENGKCYLISYSRTFQRRLTWQRFPKLFHKTQEEFYYFYWLQSDPGNIDKYVRFIKFDSTTTESDFIDAQILRETMCRIKNSELPGALQGN